MYFVNRVCCLRYIEVYPDYIVDWIGSDYYGRGNKYIKEGS